MAVDRQNILQILSMALMILLVARPSVSRPEEFVVPLSYPDQVAIECPVGSAEQLDPESHDSRPGPATRRPKHPLTTRRFIRRVPAVVERMGGDGEPDRPAADVDEQNWEMPPATHREPLSPVLRMSLSDVLLQALRAAPQIEVLRTETQIRGEETTKAESAFDWNSFIRTNWNDSSVPVGDALVGARNRFRDNHWTYESGVRRRNTIGGEFTGSQEFGHRNTNSVFFTPKNQGTSRFVLQYSQPLLRGAGQKTNRAFVEIADEQHTAAYERLLAGIQNHLLNVTRGYWDVVATRQRQQILRRSWNRALNTLSIMESRSSVDVSPVQIARARAAASQRESELIRAKYDIQAANDRLLQLIFGVDAVVQPAQRLVAIDSWQSKYPPMSIADQIERALRFRPEIRESLHDIQVAAIEIGIAENELLPFLSLTMSAFNAGLRGNSEVFRAYQDQFSKGEPSYALGVEFAYPLGNRFAKANVRQKTIGMRKLQKQLETTVSEVALEAKLAALNVVAAIEEQEYKTTAKRLAEHELHVVEKRTQHLVDGDQVGQLYLEDLLQTQLRVANAELAALEAEKTCTLAHYELRYATGELLQLDTIVE